jgi:hypothetical protein
MAKVIRESRWDVVHEHDANHAKKTFDRDCQAFPREERRLLYKQARRSRDRFHHFLHQPIARNKTIKMWENTLNPDCGDHSKCNHRSHQGYQWKNRDKSEARKSLRQHLTQGSNIIQKTDPFAGSTPANASFHVVNKNEANKHSNFTNSTEIRFPLGMISQSGNPSWQDERRRFLEILPLPAECSKMLRDLESKRQQTNKHRRRESERGKKKKPEMRREQELTVTTTERAPAILQNSRMPLPLNSSRTKPDTGASEDATRESKNDRDLKYTRLLPPFLNREILRLPVKTPGQMPLSLQIQMIHCREVNDTIVNIDINV